ncbi:MAG: BACON domain-containing protein [Bacteroidales bacterium]|nr:BACON domain-containing protein [Bacteroidales bacterium]
MKHLRYLSLVLAAAGLFSCAKPEPIPDSISATPSSVIFEAEGGEAKVAVTVTGESTDYSYSNAPNWLSITQSGRELTITAQPNLVKSARDYTLKLTNGTASCDVKISQKVGTPYLGYAIADTLSVEYAGEMMFSFIKPVLEDHGGMEYLTIGTEENLYVFELYTTNFASKDEVKLEEVEYLPGKDDYSTLTIYAQKNTFAKGVEVDDEGETYCMGSYVTNLASDIQSVIKDGKIKISKGDEGYVILVEVKDAEGITHKVVYEGDVEIDTSSAKFPSEGHPDPTENVFDAYLIQSEEDANLYTLTLLSGEDEENGIMTVFELNFDESFNPDDFSGEYYIDEENPGAPGTVNLGSLIDYGGFKFPMGSYIMFSFGDYMIADGFASLILEKQEDGSYNVSGSMSDAEMSEFYFYMNINIEIPFYPAGEEEEEE